MIKFLETNEKNLNKVYIRISNNDLNLTIANFYPNLKRLIIRINSHEVDVLKTIFINCQHLELIKIQYRYENKFIAETRFDTVANYSPKNFL